MKKWSHEGKLTIDNDELLPSQCCIYKSCVFNIFHCPLPIAYCPLPIAHCLLPIAYCLLPIAHYPLSIIFTASYLWVNATV